MVKLEIRQKKRHRGSIALLKDHFQNRNATGDAYIHTVERTEPFKRRMYYVNANWTVKVEDDNVFIMSDHISSVIDLNSETVTEIESREGWI